MTLRIPIAVLAAVLTGCAPGYRAAHDEGRRRAEACEAKRPAADAVISCYQEEAEAFASGGPQTALFFLDLTQSLRGALARGDIGNADALETLHHIKRQARIVYQLESEQRARADAAVRAQQQQALAQQLGVSWQMIQRSSPQPSALRLTSCTPWSGGLTCVHH